MIWNREKRMPIIFVSAIILFISSLFMPFVLVFLIQESVYHSKSYWFFETPTSAYITFMIGMVWIPIVLILHLIIQWKYELRLLKWITIFLICWSIPFFIYGISNYYYFDKKGLHYNHLESINQITTYEWENFKEVKEIYSRNKGITYLTNYQFLTTDNKVITLPYDIKFKENQNRIIEKLKEHDIRVTSNYMDQYE
ncbi:hypothetical protein BN000_02644 [Neobacillus massiliamazoniensis]|uniref:Uncharacterized protein n=1 Tax=Neobacillus massiliamazoniensis TaxID=1499688 RepID=A0A0U1NXF1_9BACI|nr:hypothetical protein BN000_02644 [Neobacillus massiliamazoniensis]